KNSAATCGCGAAWTNASSRRISRLSTRTCARCSRSSPRAASSPRWTTLCRRTCHWRISSTTCGASTSSSAARRFERVHPMSLQLALDTLALRPVPRFARTEYSLEYHQAVPPPAPMSGPDPHAAGRALYARWGLDFLWTVEDGLRGDWAKGGRCTDMGHAEYASDGSDLHQ